LTSPDTENLQTQSPTYGKTLIPVRTLLEGALYLAARPLSIIDMSKLAGILDTQVRQILEELSAEYETRLSAFKITELRENRFILQLRHELAPLLEDLAPTSLLNEPLLRTLGWIAHKQPISQAALAKERGSNVYKHVQELVDKKFITSTPNGRTFILETTPLFADYFGLSRDKTVLKKQILEWIEKKIKPDQKPLKTKE